MEARGMERVPPSFSGESGASPCVADAPTHRDDGQPRQLRLPTTPELKKRTEEDGAAQRAEIAATLRRLHAARDDLRLRETESRGAQRDATRRLVKLMHLDTLDQARVVAHTDQVTVQNEIDAILDKMRRLEDRYQQAKKLLSTIPDKNERHHEVQLAKEARDGAVRPLRERLQALDPTWRPSSSSQKQSEDEAVRLPSLGDVPRERKASSATYRQVTDQIRELQKARKTLPDPYMANLKMAKLWRRINDDERAVENYEKALRSLNEKEKSRIPEEDLHAVLETERRRKREALLFLFMRSLQTKERAATAHMMKQYLALSVPSERLPTVAHLEEVLRKQKYVEDPSLSTPEDVTTSILCSKSLGPLTDLRFELLQELLAASPQDPYLLEAVATFHVRKHEFEDARDVCDRFVKLPQVKRIQLFSSFAEFTPASSTQATRQCVQ